MPALMRPIKAWNRLMRKKSTINNKLKIKRTKYFSIVFKTSASLKTSTPTAPKKPILKISKS